MQNTHVNIEHPALYLQKYDFRSGLACFRDMTPEAFRRSSFLDDRILSPTSRRHDIALEQVFATGWRADNQPGRYIFHTAYCCSTLLSRVLDVACKTLVYREPMHLHQLAVMKRRPADFPRHAVSRWSELLSFSLAMLGKTWRSDEVAVTKATDSCNNIIPHLLDVHPSSRAVLLYSQAQEFISSNLKSDGRRQFLMNLLARSLRDNAQDTESILHGVNVEGLTAGELAAYVWITQIQSYRKVLKAKTDRCICIDAEILLSDTRRVLEQVDEFLGLDLGTAVIESLIGSALWGRHAKDPDRTYSPGERAGEMADLAKRIEREIEEGLAWIRRFEGWHGTVCLECEIR